MVEEVDPLNKSNTESIKPPVKKVAAKVSSKGASRRALQGELKKFDNLISKLDKSCKVALFSHPHPDPDSIGSMMGLAWFLEKNYEIEADCFFDGEVAHPQNNTMCNLLEPQLKPVFEEYKSSDYSLNILLDTVPSNAGVCDFDINFDVVIDHHRELPSVDYKGLVVHLKTGSCSAIIFYMMESLLKDGIWFEHDADEDKKVATALISGVITDTEYMMSEDTTEYEFEAFSKLFEYRNVNFLKQIVFYKRPKFWIDAKAKACSQATIDNEGYAVVGLGLIPDKQRDLLADMAEEMVSWASVETAIAFAVVGNDRIEGSVRSLDPSVSVSDFCKKLGGSYGTGGGKHGKGAYRYSLGGMSIDVDEDDDTINKTWELINQKETKRIIRQIKK